MKKKRFKVFLENGQRLVQDSKSNGETVPGRWAGVENPRGPIVFVLVRGRIKVFVTADWRLTRPGTVDDGTHDDVR